MRYEYRKFLFKRQDKWLNGVQDDMLTPLVTNLKLDPFERFHEARGFDEWQADRAWLHAPAFAQVGKLVESLNKYPPRQSSFGFDVDEALRSGTVPAR